MPDTSEIRGDRAHQDDAHSISLRPKPSASSRYYTISVSCFFLAILLLGLGARLAHLTAESVWWDEFATVAFLDVPDSHKQSPHYERWNQQVIRQSSPSLNAFLAQNRLVDPAAMPLYLGIEYFWNKYAHRSVVSLRLLSLLISMATLPLLFLLGRRLFNERAGLIVMFCFALSPIHVQFAKEIRMYGLMTLLAVALVYTFFHLLHFGKRRWWALYAVVAGLLSWTHPFALLLPFTLGLFWLTAYPKDIRRIIAWSALNACVLLPAVTYVLTIQFWGEDSTGGWMRLPSVPELFTDIFADDAIGMTYQINATPTAWQTFVSAEAARLILAWRWTIGRIMAGGALAAIAWLLYATYMFQGCRAGFQPAGNTVPAGCKPALQPLLNRFKWAYLLTLWLIVPPLVLYVLSIVWRPCIMPRYTVHCSIALYLIVGGAVSMIPMRMLHVGAATLVCLFYGYQQMLMIGEPQHPDWKGATALIRSNAAESDLVLSYNWLWKRVFAFNLGPTPLIVSYGSTHDILAEQSAFFLNMSHPLNSDYERDPWVWIVVRTDYFEQGPIKELERELSARDLLYEHAEYRGIQHVLLYRVWAAPNRSPALNPNQQFKGEAAKEFSDLALEYWCAAQYETAAKFADYANRIDPGYARAWSYKGMALKELNQREEALEALRRAVAIDRLDYPWSHVNIAMLLVDLERYEEAVNAALRALEILPDDAWAYAMLGQAQLGLAEYDAALEALRRAATLNSDDMRIQRLLQEAEEVSASALRRP